MRCRRTIYRTFYPLLMDGAEERKNGLTGETRQMHGGFGVCCSLDNIANILFMDELGERPALAREIFFCVGSRQKMGLFKKSCNQEIPNNCRRTSFYTQVIVTVALKPVAFSPATGGCQIIKSHFISYYCLSIS